MKVDSNVRLETVGAVERERERERVTLYVPRNLQSSTHTTYEKCQKIIYSTLAYYALVFLLLIKVGERGQYYRLE